MKKIYAYSIGLVFIVLFLFIYNGKSYKFNKMEYRDSVLIDYVLQYCFNSREKPGTTNWSISIVKKKLEHPLFSYQIGNIYYSSDFLKAIAFYSYSVPEYVKDENEPEKYFYGSALALLRDSLKQPWQIYELNLIGPSGWSSKEEIWNILEEYYHSSIKHQAVQILNPNLNYYELIEKLGMFIDSSGKVRNKPTLDRNEIIKLRSTNYKDDIISKYKSEYTLDDPEFWTESIIWKKGLRVPWLYNFQTESHIIIEDQIIEYNIPYPDSIINMYKNSN